MGAKAPRIEVVDVENRPREIEVILRHYLDRLRRDPDAFTGMMIVMELPGGAFEMKYTGASNVAERLGRLDILHAAMLDGAVEDGEPEPEPDETGPGFQPGVVRRQRKS